MRLLKQPSRGLATTESSTDKIALCVALVALALSLFPLLARADSDTGTVSGYVRLLDVSRTHGNLREGTVREPLAGVPVTIEGVSGMWRMQTDKHGFYTAFGIPPGKYHVYAERIGPYWAVPGWADRYICVHADEDRAVNLFLDNGLHESLYSSWVLQRQHLQWYEPDASQTSDFYSVGEC